MSSPLKQNTTTIQNLLDAINSLPEAGGVELPELSNEGSASELFAGKELIDGEGKVVTGSFTIDSELTAQDNLITQIQTALQGKAAATGSENLDAELTEQEGLISQLSTILDSKASGGGDSSGYETCTIKVVCGRGVTEFLVQEHALTCVSNNGVQANIFYDYGDPKTGTELIFENVLCGSAIYIYWFASGGSLAANISNNMDSADYSSIFVAPTQQGEVGVITIYDGDA